MLRIPSRLLDASFSFLRACGKRRCECQVLWLAHSTGPMVVCDIAHSDHRSHASGFELSNQWLSELWLQLASTNTSIVAQVHTHPGRAFHSKTDDAFPIVHTPGFLSIVVPNFGRGSTSLESAYATTIGSDGAWHAMSPDSLVSVI